MRLRQLHEHTEIVLDEGLKDALSRLDDLMGLSQKGKEEIIAKKKRKQDIKKHQQAAKELKLNKKKTGADVTALATKALQDCVRDLGGDRSATAACKDFYSGLVKTKF